MGVDALSMMGMRRYNVQRAMHTFRKSDEAILQKRHKVRHQHDDYIRDTRLRIQDLENMMLEDIKNFGTDKDLGWDNTSRKQEFKPIVDEAKRSSP